MTTATLSYGQREVTYRVKRWDRGTLQITVFPDCKVEVVAPESATDEAIQTRVRRRLRWISRQLRSFENFFPKPAPREYVSGESWLYQGRQYRLKVQKAEGPAKVALRRPLLVVEARNPKDAAEVRRLLGRWYRQRATERLLARFEECGKRIAPYGIKLPEVRLQAMSKRWGSYSPAGRILLNPELVKAPVECIDYVILHELCHVKQRRHDRHFYELLQRVVPNWLSLKHRLEHLNI